MTPLFTILRRIKPLPLAHQIAHLKVLVQAEKPRSVRRIELEALLKQLLLRQLRKENRSAA